MKEKEASIFLAMVYAVLAGVYVVAGIVVSTGLFGGATIFTLLSIVWGLRHAALIIKDKE